MRRLSLAPLLLAALVALPACDSGGPDAIGITGTWEGVVFDPDTPGAPRFPITLRLNDTGQMVTGSGTVELPEGPFTFTVVNGSFLNAIVDLRLRFEQPPFEGSISGRLTNQDPGEITGTISARGDANGDLVIELTAR